VIEENVLKRRLALLILLVGLVCLALVCARAGGPSATKDGRTTGTTPVRTWGRMREVLRDGHAQGRVALSEVARPGSYGVGSLANLSAEVTIDDGQVYLSEVKDGQLVIRPVRKEDQATLLVVAQVDAWDSYELPAVSDVDELERVILAKVRAAGFDPTAAPIPLRLTADFAKIDVHVLNGSCPRAHPEGPAPWELTGATAQGVLIGIYVEGRAGIWTHHGERMHLHCILRTSDGRVVAGHVDAVRIEAGGQLQLPHLPPSLRAKRRLKASADGVR